MKRQALIIANPGETGARNYCEGVNKDCNNYPTFLTEPFGGAWYTSEIEVLRRPSVSELRVALGKLKSADYGLVVFAGHAEYVASRRTTVLELRKGEEIDSMELRAGASKQTVILDCCRLIAPETRRTFAFTEALAKRASLGADACRRQYENRITKCPPGLAVLWGCSIGQTAGDDPTRGGYYSFSLLEEAENWAKNSNVDVSTHFAILDVVVAHDLAAKGVQGVSGGRQTATMEKPRSDPYFPFAIVA